MSTEPESQPIAEEIAVEETTVKEPRESSALKVAGWISLGLTVAALGIYAGRKLRSRYKFNRRTPYDFYDHTAGKQAGEFGLGV
ncbi:MAG: hypothetical protein ABR991_07245 [Terracidiphilus sp.]|jgi:hypothetical protein